MLNSPGFSPIVIIPWLPAHPLGATVGGSGLAGVGLGVGSGVGVGIGSVVGNGVGVGI